MFPQNIALEPVFISQYISQLHLSVTEDLVLSEYSSLQTISPKSTCRHVCVCVGRGWLQIILLILIGLRGPFALLFCSACTVAQQIFTISDQHDCSIKSNTMYQDICVWKMLRHICPFDGNSLRVQALSQSPLFLVTSTVPDKQQIFHIYLLNVRINGFGRDESKSLYTHL